MPKYNIWGVMKVTKSKWISLVGVSILVIIISACSNTIDKKDSTGENSMQNELVDQTPDHSKANTGTDEPRNAKDAGEDANNETDEQSSNVIKVNENNSITALVNKQNSLDEDYVPDDLVMIDVPYVLENPEVNQLRQVAADALQDMFEIAEKSDIYLYARSGYRSYQTQVQLFESYKEKHGEEAANRYSARPGQSEHQTGLVMDVTSESVNFQLKEKFGETKEGKWLEENAHKFGFIIRYPEGMEDITGYTYEPWHIRFLGVDLATKIYESGLTYEEYLVKEGIIHETNAEAVNSET